MLLDFFRTEIRYFTRLNQAARALLFSTVVWAVSAPLFNIFTNAYIWQHSSDVQALLFFNVSWFITVYFSFRTAKIVTTWLDTTTLFALGLGIYGLAGSAVFLFTDINLLTVTLLGAFLGFASGFYWSMKLFLMQTVTESDQRYYYTSLDLSVVTVCAIIMPAVIGLFLQYATNLLGLSTDGGYRLLIGIADLFFLVGALFVYRADFPRSRKLSLDVGVRSPVWKGVRKVTVIAAITNGILAVIPSITLLLFFKGEHHFGLAFSAASLVGALATYLLGRFAGDRAKILGLQTGIVTLTIGAVGLMIFFSGPAAVLFVMLQGVSSPLIWGFLSPLAMNGIADSRQDHAGRFAYVVDREQALCVGRTFGSLVLLGCLSWISIESLIRFAFPLLCLSLVPVIWIVKPVAAALPFTASASKPESSA